MLLYQSGRKNKIAGTDQSYHNWRMYIADEPKTVQQISELENVSDKTVYNDFRIACAAISVYLLGA